MHTAVYGEDDKRKTNEGAKNIRYLNLSVNIKNKTQYYSDEFEIDYDDSIE